MIAYCGLACDCCPIYMATCETNEVLQHSIRDEVVRICSEQYGLMITADDVNDCDGCISDSGRLFTGCQNCEIRKCAVNRELENCAYCTDFACEILRKHFVHDSESRIRLEGIRDSS